MASILRVRTTWTGYQGVPYLSTHYFTRTDADSAGYAADAVQALWVGCEAIISNQLSWNVEPEVAVLESTTGALTGVDNIGDGLLGTGTNGNQVNPFSTQGPRGRLRCCPRPSELRSSTRGRRPQVRRSSSAGC